MIRMPNLTDDFKALESGTFFVDDNICLLGNVAGFFTDINNNIYINRRGKLFFEGLYYRLQCEKNTVIIAESDVIQEYKDLFNYMFETTQYSNNRYNFPQKYPEAITFVDVGLGGNCWENNKTNIFNRYINYTRDNKMKFDHIIANPPFEFGNQITTTVLDNVDFNEYVNLMPTSEYEKKNLSKHIIDSIYIPSADASKFFGVACPILEVARLSKKEVNNYSKVERLCMRDAWLEKWYKKNISRNGLYSVYGNVFRRGRCGKKDRPAAFDPDSFNLYNEDFFQSAILFNMYFINNGNHNEEGNAWDVLWNVKCKDYKEFCDIILNTVYPPGHKKAGERVFNPDAHCLKFNTATEKKNCVKWMREGKLYEIILKKLITGGTIDLIREVIIPHVDWSKEWTDEEILKDYGYTDEEIKELLK